jgi:enoyl-[acyl-carrier protein] reductase I
VLIITLYFCPWCRYSDDVGGTAAFLLSPLARAVTGVTLYVDNGLFAMGMALDSASMVREEDAAPASN